MSKEQLTPLQILDLSIEEAFPKIFHRGTVYVSTSTSIIDAALFLIPTNELYASGIIVMKDQFPVGRIRPIQILRKVLEVGYKECLNLEAKDVMVSIGTEIRSNFSLRSVLELFSDTKFGFTPIIKNELMVGTLSTRDFLPLIERLNLTRPVSDFANDLIFVSPQISIENTLQIMSKKNLRKIVVKHNDELRVIEIRTLLEYLFSWKKGKPNILDDEIGLLPKSDIMDFTLNTTISETARLIAEKNPYCVIHENKIVTAWDLVMKALGPFIVQRDVDDAALD